MRNWDTDVNSTQSINQRLQNYQMQPLEISHQ